MNQAPSPGILTLPHVPLSYMKVSKNDTTEIMVSPSAENGSKWTYSFTSGTGDYFQWQDMPMLYETGQKSRAQRLKFILQEGHIFCTADEIKEYLSQHTKSSQVNLPMTTDIQPQNGIAGTLGAPISTSIINENGFSVLTLTIGSSASMGKVYPFRFFARTPQGIYYSQDPSVGIKTGPSGP